MLVQWAGGWQAVAPMCCAGMHMWHGVRLSLPGADLGIMLLPAGSPTQTSSCKQCDKAQHTVHPVAFRQ